MFLLWMVALNNERGRDHGIPRYNDCRKICDSKAGAAQSFNEFRDVFSQSVINKLENTYEHPDDIDLFVGGILERRPPGEILGPVFRCLIGD